MNVHLSGSFSIFRAKQMKFKSPHFGWCGLAEKKWFANLKVSRLPAVLHSIDSPLCLCAFSENIAYINKFDFNLTFGLNPEHSLPQRKFLYHLIYSLICGEFLWFQKISKLIRFHITMIWNVMCFIGVLIRIHWKIIFRVRIGLTTCEYNGVRWQA